MLAKLSNIVFYRLGVEYNQREHDVTDIENREDHCGIAPSEVVAIAFYVVNFSCHLTIDASEE
jgi:hypothetical protein